MLNQVGPPCGHGQPVDGCPACLLYGTDPNFRAAWGAAAAPQAAQAPARSLPCVYLGDVTDKMECNCPGRWKRKCALLKREVTIGEHCRHCADYDAA